MRASEREGESEGEDGQAQQALGESDRQYDSAACASSARTSETEKTRESERVQLHVPAVEPLTCAL